MYLFIYTHRKRWVTLRGNYFTAPLMATNIQRFVRVVCPNMLLLAPIYNITLRIL